MNNEDDWGEYLEEQALENERKLQKQLDDMLYDCSLKILNAYLNYPKEPSIAHKMTIEMLGLFRDAVALDAYHRSHKEMQNMVRWAMGEAMKAYYAKLV